MFKIRDGNRRNETLLLMQADYENGRKCFHLSLILLINHYSNSQDYKERVLNCMS